MASSGSWVTSSVQPAEVAQVPAQLGADVQPGAGVERGERLVEQQQPRVGGQGAGQGDPLRLPAGQAPRAVRRRGRRARPGRASAAAAGAGLAGAAPRRAQAEGDVLERGQVREEQVVLEHDADRPALGAARTSAAGSSRTSPSSAMRPRRAAAARPARAARWSCRRRSGRAARRPRRRATVQLRRRARKPRRGSTRRSASSGHGRRPPVSQRSRRPTRTATETASRTRLKHDRARRGSVSSAR